MVTMKVKLLRFDSKVVKRSMDPVVREALRQGGAYVRKVAMRSMGNKPGPSRPGKPPHSHTGHLKRGIRYGYDPIEQAVAIGVMRGGLWGAPALEYGGKAKIKRPTRGGRRVVRRRVHIRARPFMGPAKERTEPKMEGFFAQARVKQKGR